MRLQIAIFTLLAVSTSSLADGLVEETGELSPGDPGGQHTNLCTFKDHWEMAEELGHFIEQSDYRAVINYVQECKDVCVQLYGAGNPDITGIGAMACYYIQAVLVLLGPILNFLLDHPVIMQVIPTSASLENLRKSIASFSNSVHFANILFSLTIIVAACIRCHGWKDVPLMEIPILKTLSFYELGTCGYTFLSHLIARRLYYIDVDRIKVHEGLAGVLIFVTTVAHSAIAFAELRVFSWTASPLGSKALNEVVRTCATLHGYPFPSYSHDFVHSEGWFPSGSWNVQDFAFFYMAPAIGFLFLLFIVFKLRHNAEEVQGRACVACTHRTVVETHGSLSWRETWIKTLKSLLLDQRLLRDLFFLAFVGGTCGMFLYDAFNMLQQVSKNQKLLKKAAGDEFKDDQWGFGQITIMMMWLPLLRDVVKLYFDHRKRAKDIQTELQEQNSQKAIDNNDTPSTSNDEIASGISRSEDIPTTNTNVSTADGSGLQETSVEEAAESISRRRPNATSTGGERDIALTSRLTFSQSSDGI